MRIGMLAGLAALLILPACQPDTPPSLPAPVLQVSAVSTLTPAIPTHTPAPTLTNTVPPQPSPTIPSTATPVPTPTTGAYGPQNFLDTINPLTGLPYPQESDTSLPAALVSLSNSPVTTRPQAGLSFAPLVFEIYLGVGDTRFLALFPPSALDQLAAEIDGEETALGPVRSGRLPYNTLRQYYNAFTVFAGASDRVLKNLDYYSTVINDNPDDINGASISVAELRGLSELFKVKLGSGDYTGNSFDPQPPPDGKPADGMWINYHYFSQVFWRYNQAEGAYNRYQNDGEATPLRQFTDRLNDEPLSFENVIVLFAQYHFYDPTFFDIDFKYVYRYPALLFRDGQVYQIFWTTRSFDYEQTSGRLRPIHFIDYDGNPFPLKNGQTWVSLVNLYSPYYEAPNTENYYQLANNKQPGSGFWAVQFFMPAFEPYPGGVVPYEKED